MELSRIRELKQQIEEAELNLEALRGRLESVSSILKRLPEVLQRNSSLKSKVEELASQVMDSERELENLRGELSESVIALTQEILERVRGNSAQVLIRRYCVGKSFKEIVFEMHYSQSHIFRLYQQGVQQFNSAETKARNSLANHVPDKFKCIINAKTLQQMTSQKENNETEPLEFDSPRATKSKVAAIVEN